MGPHDQISGLNLDDVSKVETVESLAGLLRQLRRRMARQRGDSQLTYRELAAKTGWAHGVIGDYFTGKTLPPTDRFDVLIGLLGATTVEQGVLATARDRVEEVRRSSGPTDIGISAWPPAPVPIPHELPPDVFGFTGRARELATLHNLLHPLSGPGPVVISAIDGAGGIGKSVLAIHAAHQVADRFPDGQLYANLQGCTCGLLPLLPTVVLARFLRALGVAHSDISDNEAEASAMFRTLATTRRLLVVLDNASDATQVRSLLPASPTCAVLITSRQVLAALDGATHLHLDVLPAREALVLLGRLAGQQRLKADRPAAEQVARQCGYLPLALRIAGARLAARPHWPIRALADRLADTRHRFDELQYADLQVRTSFQVSYQTLQESGSATDRTAAAAFPLLALLDGPDLSLPVAACLLDQEEPVAELSLERLVDTHLLETSTPSRYRFHDLLRLFARELVVQRYTPDDRTAAIVRAMNWYVASSWQTFRLLRPGDSRPALERGRWEHGEMTFTGMADALEWLETERANLLAAIPQAAAAPGVPTEIPIALAQALSGFFQAHCYWYDWITVNQTVLALARRIGDQAAEAQACCDLNVAYELRGQYKQAIAHLREGLTIFRELGDRHGEAACLNGLGVVYDSRALYAEAMAYFEESLAIRQELGDRYGQAVSVNNIGVVHKREGRYEQALACYHEGLEISRQLGNRRTEAGALTNLGEVHERRAHYAEALACHDKSLAVFRELGDRQGEALNLHNQGRVRACQHQFTEALACLEECLSIQQELGERRGEAECLQQLGSILHALGEHKQALTRWQQALAIFEELGVPAAEEVRTLLEHTDGQLDR